MEEWEIHPQEREVLLRQVDTDVVDVPQTGEEKSGESTDEE